MGADRPAHPQQAAAQSARRQMSAEQPWAMTVAMAAPCTSMRSVETKIRSSVMFTAQATIIATRGVLPSPTERRMAEKRLNAITTGRPQKMMPM